MTNLLVDKYSLKIISSFLDLKDITNKIIDNKIIIEGTIDTIWKLFSKLKNKIEINGRFSPK
tara:strand:+ start:272 stop:457 length:186 start_codon:yes stop_codon:yes gene_type:complete